MLVSDVANVIVSSKKILSNRLRDAVDKNIFIHDHPISSSTTPGKDASLLKKRKLPASLNIFEIKFNYLQQPYSTKVLKVNHKYGDPFYKVVLYSNMGNRTTLYWVQFQLTRWVMLLGQELDEKLKLAITSAIESHELLPLFKIL